MKKKGIIKRSAFVLFLSVCILVTSISTVYASASDLGNLESDESLASEITYTDISSPYKESLLVYEDGVPILLTRVVCENSVSVTATDEFGNILASAITWLDGQTLMRRENNSIIETVGTITNRYLQSATYTSIRSSSWGTESFIYWSFDVTTFLATTLAIACYASGLELDTARQIAELVLNLEYPLIYVKTGISMRSDSEYTYCRRRNWFYSNPARTALITGPWTAIQKKSNQY